MQGGLIIISNNTMVKNHVLVWLFWKFLNSLQVFKMPPFSTWGSKTRCGDVEMPMTCWTTINYLLDLADLPPWELAAYPIPPAGTFESMIFSTFEGGICLLFCRVLQYVKSRWHQPLRTVDLFIAIFSAHNLQVFHDSFWNFGLYHFAGPCL